MRNQTILVTGGAGYIGSHTCVKLQAHGFDVVILDNFSNSSLVVPQRISQITGMAVKVYQGDIRDADILYEIFAKHNIYAVIHFAGLKAVAESIGQPVKYYDNNIGGTLTLINMMEKFNVKNFVFSSSATVYGHPETLPIKEDAPRSYTNPYGHSKMFIEDVMMTISEIDPTWKLTALRYFNPIGAHSSGRIGEAPSGVPNNIMPYILQVAKGKLSGVNVYGGDYETKDGTGARDYIHVVDLAEGHIAALDHLKPGFHAYNLGTGKAYTVLELIEWVRIISGQPIPYEIVGRREGDVASCYADPSLARYELEWETKRDLRTMCIDAWHWQDVHPNGYD